jgi:hypothetical protein
MKWPFGILLAALLPASACDLTGPCTTDPKPAIRVKIVDAATGGPPEAANVTATVTDGSYTDVATVPVPPTGFALAYLAFERPGIYRVEVQAQGYTPWVEQDVRALDTDECGVKAVDLTARLEKAAGS